MVLGPAGWMEAAGGGGSISAKKQPSRSGDVGSLGLKPDRVVEGAAGSAEGHGGDVAVITRR